MPRRSHSVYPTEKRPPSELAQIERMMREEGVHSASGEALLRPKTAQALAAIRSCKTLDDLRKVCRENRAWRIRRGETCEHEL